MLNQPNERDVLDKCEKLRQKAAELQAEYEAMDPDECIEFDRRVDENGPELELLSEIIVKAIDGSMPADEAQRWIDAADREIDAWQARRLRSKGE